MDKISRFSRQFKVTLGFFFGFTLLFFWADLSPLRAGQLVAAKYLPIVGQEVAVEISISEPPPQTIIVVQSLPAQVSILQAKPLTKSINSDKGEVKWLLNDLKAGTRVLRLNLDRSLSLEEISGEIRYREPGGEMVIVSISKP